MEEPTTAVRRALSSRVRGPVFGPGDGGYETARQVWNARIDTYPSIVVRPTGVADVMAAIDVAGEYGLTVGVKGGGHHVSGRAIPSDGLLLDMSSLSAAWLDPNGETVHVAGGATWGVVDHETRPFGLAAVGGQDPNIGVVGMTLGGGVGWLSRPYGLAADNLIDADVVTAEGELVRASASSNDDLFWGLRGGGGGLGVVTRLSFTLHPVDTVLAGSFLFPIERLSQALRRYRRLSKDAPSTLRPLLGVFELPPSSPLVDRVDSSWVAMIIVCAVEPFEAAQRALETVRRSPEPLIETVKPRSYHRFQRAGESRGRARTTLRGQYFDDLTDQVFDILEEYLIDPPSAGVSMFVSPRGGAEIEPPVSATAYPHRYRGHHLVIEARWDDPHHDDSHDTWVRSVHDDLKRHAADGASINFIDVDEPPSRIRAAYGPNLERMRTVKERWDPMNRFGGPEGASDASER